MLQDMSLVIETESMQSSAVSSLPSQESHSARHEGGPPRTIRIPTSPLDRKQAFYLSSSYSSPYAQLCYDPQHATLAAIMETSRRKANGRSTHMVATDITTPESFPSLVAARTADTTTWSSSSSSTSLSCASTVTLSTLTEGRHRMGTLHMTSLDKQNMPFVLGMDFSNEDDENCLYLLHDCSGDPYNKPARGSEGCTKALQRLVKSASRPSLPRFMEKKRRSTTTRIRKPLRLAKQQGYVLIPNESSGRSKR